jgi:hypothetical protein
MARLAEQVEAVCAAAERLFTASTHFEAATSERRVLWCRLPALWCLRP